MRVNGHWRCVNLLLETASNSTPQFHCTFNDLVRLHNFLQPFINFDRREIHTVQRGTLPEKLSRSDLTDIKTSWPKDSFHFKEKKTWKCTRFSSLREDGLKRTAVNFIWFVLFILLPHPTTQTLQKGDFKNMTNLTRKSKTSRHFTVGTPAAGLRWD